MANPEPAAAAACCRSSLFDGFQRIGTVRGMDTNTTSTSPSSTPQRDGEARIAPVSRRLLPKRRNIGEALVLCSPAIFAAALALGLLEFVGGIGQRDVSLRTFYGSITTAAVALGCLGLGLLLFSTRQRK